jgi:hypothetical protein
LLSDFHPAGETSSQNCGKEISSGAPVPKAESVCGEVSFFLPCRIRLPVEGRPFQGAPLDFLIFYFYFKVYPLERIDRLLLCATVSNPLEGDLLGRPVHPFLSPLYSADPSTQTEIRDRKMKTGQIYFKKYLLRKKNPF